MCGSWPSVGVEAMCAPLKQGEGRRYSLVNLNGSLRLMLGLLLLDPQPPAC